MSTQFGEVLREDRRGAILRILADQEGYGLNEGVIQDALQKAGHTVARDVVKGDLSWLQDQGLLQVDEVSSVWIATLTQRGDDVAAGRARVPGVKRPKPRA